jgi:hypothetical protein
VPYRLLPPATRKLIVEMAQTTSSGPPWGPGSLMSEHVREAAETRSSTLAVACRHCIVILDEPVKSSGRGLRVADVAMLLVGALEGSR